MVLVRAAPGGWNRSDEVVDPMRLGSELDADHGRRSAPAHVDARELEPVGATERRGDAALGREAHADAGPGGRLHAGVVDVAAGVGDGGPGRGAELLAEVFDRPGDLPIEAVGADAVQERVVPGVA